MSTADTYSLVKSIPCFAGLGPLSTERLDKAVSERSYAKGEVFMLEGEPCPGLFVVKTGSVKLYRSSPEGEEQIVRLVHRGDCFECVPFFDGGTNPVSAQALEASSVYFLPAAEFKWMLANCPDVAMAFAPILAKRLRSLVSLVGDFSHRRVYPRLARLLCQLSERKDGRVVVSPSTPLHQQHLACMLGCSRQVVNTSLRRLVKEGVIGMEGHQILVLNLETLRKVG